MMPTSIFKDLEDLIRSSVSQPSSATPAQILADIGCPSASIAILEEGNITAHCITTGTDNTDTLFQACSISKPVAGLAIMKLVDLGYFTVDDKVCDLLPEEVVQLMAKDTRTEALLRTVTVKHLMSHTSGLSVHGFPGYTSSEQLPSTYQVIEGRTSANTQSIKMLTLPGLDFMYSGGGIMVLQCAVEHIMQFPFAEIMQTFVFEPLGMTRSHYHIPKNENNIARAHYTGHYAAPNQWHTLPELAAAGLWTTPTDLLKVVRAIQDSLSGTKSETILKKETAELMLHTIKTEIALTWFTNSSSFGHGGDNLPGYKTFLFGYADLPWNVKAELGQERTDATITRDCGISIMTNAATGGAVIEKLLLAIAYLKGWPEPSTYPFGGPCALAPLSGYDLADYTCCDEWISHHWSGPAGRWTIASAMTGNLVAGLSGQVLIPLKPAAISAKVYDEHRNSIDLVMDGVAIMLRLGWLADERIVEVWNAGTGEISVLYKESTTP